MSLLKNVSASVQQVAEAIAIAIGLEVEIVDNELTIIGGSGKYIAKRGQKEEAGMVDGNYLYARVLRSGNTEYIADAQHEEFYSEREDGNILELAEICTPIKIDSKIIGIIGLIAINEKQKQILLDKERKMVVFVEKMSELLSAKASQQAILREAEIANNEMITILETTHEGIFAINKNGYIRHSNSIAEMLFNTTKSDIVGSHINRFMMGSPSLEVIRTGIGYTENEEIYKRENGNLHLIVTAKPYMGKNEINGVVLSFRDIAEAEKLVYKINTRALKYTFEDILGESESMKRAKNQALLTARGNSTVLIMGESGTGKEMFAKSIHYASSRAKHPFVSVNCGAIPENLLESELFGYEKGAFTGASEKGKIGKFELATKGTIFLDEIGDMPLHLQVKILHVLQNMRYERVGGNKTVIVDVRVIAATNKNLEKMIKEGSFREDLYYRLSVIPMSIPPLRERKGDIKLLMYHFLEKYNTFMNRKITGFDKEAEQAYLSYDWPGNVRELENAVEYGTNMAFGQTIGIDSLPARLLKTDKSSIPIEHMELPLSEQLKFYEKAIINRELRKHQKDANCKDIVAKELGMSRATLYRKLSELEIK